MKIVKDVILNPFNLLLWSITLAMIIFVGSILQTYTHLKYEHPLKNFDGGIKSPIYLDYQNKIEAYGTFDRDIACKMIDFTLLLKSVKTNDVHMLDKRHLLVIPKEYGLVGTNIKVNFVLSLPNSIKEGKYIPIFNGTYFCKEGLFSDLKHVNIQVAPIDIVKK
jgi:hypothetical protein